MNERRYPIGYIPLTMHELGGVARDERPNNSDYPTDNGHDDDRDLKHHGRRHSRGRRNVARNRTSNPRHSSNRNNPRSSRPNRGRLRFSHNDSPKGERDDF